MFKNATIIECPSSQEKHTVYIGARVTPEEKKWITSQAMKCGMSVSDYLVARAHDYCPRERLTPRQEEILNELKGVRSDLRKFFSIWNSKRGKEREDFLNKYSNIILWIGDLKKLETRVTSIIDDFFSENPVP